MRGVVQVSVIVVTYQWPAALDRVLASLAAQLESPHEVIVADDGSGPETKAVVDGWRRRMSFPLYHVWQPDEGFRAAEIRNRGAARATSDYLLFLDGDCMVMPDFIQRHRQLAEAGCQMVGNRLLLDPVLSEQVLAGDAMPTTWGWREWLRARFGQRVNRLLPLLRLGDGPWRKFRSHRWRGAHSCNLGIWRQDFLTVNGFDENFRGWGHEDADLVVRLIAGGVLRKDGSFAVPVLHLWHRHSPRDLEPENLRRFHETLAGQRKLAAERGVDAHLADEATK